MKISKTGRISPKEGRKSVAPKKVEAPRRLTGKLKQSEGFTPAEALTNPRKAGLLSSSKRSTAARERRLEGKPM